MFLELGATKAPWRGRVRKVWGRTGPTGAQGALVQGPCIFPGNVYYDPGDRGGDEAEGVGSVEALGLVAFPIGPLYPCRSPYRAPVRPP